MATPKLILSIDEGPKKGETLDRMPGTFIRIGRVVRGNTIGIKDAGISQKHLNIAFHPDISRWAVTDLGTSNGTIVNGAVISPSAPFPLADGDIMKIGEKTWMSVKIYTPSFAPEPRTRRGRRIATAVTSPNGEEAEKEKVAQPEKYVENGASQGNSCPESANINDAMKPMLEAGKRKRPTRASTMAGISSNGASQGNSCPESANISDAMKPTLEAGKRRRPTRASTTACSSSDQKEHQKVDVKENDEEATKNYQKGRAQRKKGTMVLEGDCRSVTSAIESTTGVLKSKDAERKAGHEKVEEPTKNGRKGRGRLKSGLEPTARILRKDVHLEPVTTEHKTVSVVKALPMASSARILIMKEEASEKIKGLIIDVKEVRAHSKRSGGSATVSWKDQVMEPVMVVPRRGRVTRASNMALNRSAWVSSTCEDALEEIVVETDMNRGKQRVRGKRGGRSTRISSTCNALESVAIQVVDKSLTRVLNATEANSARVSRDIQKNKMMAELDLEPVYLKGREKMKSKFKNNANGDGKKLAVRREVSFRVEEADNDKNNMTSSDPNKTDDSHFPNKMDLAYLWNSFSEIRGIPNTTSKYREDRMINCHATPFEARVERALNRGITETSSIVET